MFHALRARGKVLVVAFTLLLLCTAFAVTRPAFAQTVEQLAELQRLLALVAELQRQLAILEGGTTTQPPVVPGNCPALYRSVYLGANGADVSELQQFLATTGDYTFGAATGYFGPATESAVQKFQCRTGIICNGSPNTTGYGAVGPSTRGEITRHCGSPVSIPYPPYLPSPIPLPPPPPVTCSVGSITMNQGETRTFFLQSLVPGGSSCQQSIRTCQSSGFLSGDSAYTAPICSVQNIQCSVGSITMQVGETRTFYKNATVPYGSTCQSGLRACQSSGVVSGDAAYVVSSCAPNTTPADCTIPATGSQATTTIQHGASQIFHSTSTVPQGQSCSSVAQTRTCNNGTLSGSGVYTVSSCTVANNCTVGGVTVPHGTSRTFYSSATLAYPSGQSCESIAEVRICWNGVLSGSATSVAPECVISKDCTENGILVLNGVSSQFYSTSTVLFGQNCAAFRQTRTCTDGTLSGSGSYKFGSCVVGSAKACPAVDGKVVQHGSGATFYSFKTRPYNRDCDASAQNRVCNDGILSGSVTYQYATCTEEKEENCTLDGQTFAPGKHKVYSQTSVAADKSCSTVAQERVCRDGAWISGDAKYNRARCAPIGKRWCKQDNAYVADSKSKVFYSTRTVEFGRTCFGVSRSCDDSVLKGSGTYQYAKCRIEEPQSCVLDGKTVKHNGSAVFYSSEQESTERRCNQLSKTRTCFNGILGGEGKFRFAECTTVEDANDPQ